MTSLGRERIRAVVGGVTAALCLFLAELAFADPATWRSEWPRTDFSRHTVALAEIVSGGPPKDGIPPIDAPQFRSIAAIEDLGEREPVIAVAINGDTRAYPLRILTWHEIVNDTVGGVPVAVTYCPLCNAAIVFDRRIKDSKGKARVLDFGTTGKLRHSDLVMYDRETESWWQQFLGEAIVGELAGTRLIMLPVRVESYGRFKARGGGGRVLVPNEPRARSYGRNPYARYDGAARPFLYSGALPQGIAPLARVVVVGEEAWSLDLLRERGRIAKGDLVLSWEAGQASALDTEEIANGRDVGNVIVQRRTARGLEDVVHDVSFAFAFHAFHPKGRLHVK